jgi:hypothetical protein
VHYIFDGRGVVLHIVVHQKVQLSEAIVTDILESHHLPVIFNTLDPVRTRKALDPVENLTDLELFQNLASELRTPNIQIHSSNVAEKAARDFAVSVASAYRLLARKTTISDWKCEIHGLDRLLKRKRKLRKLWQETRDPAYKMAVNLVT